MEVRAKNGKGPLLFEWDPDLQTIDLIRKDMYYKVQLDNHAYCVREECSKYECKRPDTRKTKTE
jgi:hypothetical protein